MTIRYIYDGDHISGGTRVGIRGSEVEVKEWPMEEVIWRKLGEKTKWRVGYHFLANTDGGFLSNEQHDQLVRLFLEMAEYADPLSARIARVERISDYYELKEKGGIFKKLNVRVYFTIEEDSRTIVVMSVYKKEEEGKVHRHMLLRNKERLRRIRKQLASE